MKKVEFKNYLNDRLIAKHEDGFAIIIPSTETTTIPAVCENCEYFLRTSLDEEAYNELKCCDFCARNWAKARKQEWLNGWRPPKEDVDVANSQRPPLSFVFSES